MVTAKEEERTRKQPSRVDQAVRAFMWVHDHGELTPPSEEDYRAVYDGPDEGWAEAFARRLIGRLPDEVTEERHARMLLARMVVCDNLQGDFDPTWYAISYTREDGSRVYAFECEQVDALRMQAVSLFGLRKMYELAESLMYEVFLLP